ncbi:MAG: hypothetical protein ABEK42_12710, partial [Thiohalorhabdaceae bacterium]
MPTSLWHFDRENGPPMRTLFAFLLAPAAGLAVFTLVWAAPEIQLARGGPQIGLTMERFTPVWLI